MGLADKYLPLNEPPSIPLYQHFGRVNRNVDSINPDGSIELKAFDFGGHRWEVVRPLTEGPIDLGDRQTGIYIVRNEEGEEATATVLKYHDLAKSPTVILEGLEPLNE